MTHAHLDRRVTDLEARIREAEDGFGESQLKLTRRVTAIEIVQRRSFCRILERLGVPIDEISQITVTTDDEIDAVLEEDC
ncbi:hypothetical protein ACQPZ2_39155 [Nocardia pseudovaccinii]|uniref:hypothetical protein n=1 Tax=Nocardia pseudovaccinii TaxID=189540 RepID=UPI003D8B6641